MAKVRIEVVPDFGARPWQVLCGIVVDANYNSVLKAIQNKLKLSKKDAQLVTLSAIDGTGAQILPRGDLRGILHDGAQVVVSKCDSAEGVETSEQSAMDSEIVQGSQWPSEAFTVGNAGVMLVGRSKKNNGLPVTLLGGRFYTGKKLYAYTDFGGGVERKDGETPQQGALREFVEELLGQTAEEAKVTASKLCSATASSLVGGRPFIHKNNYAIFIVPAEVVVEALQLSKGAEDESAIDVLFAQAKRNSELTSVALVSIEELLRAALRAARCDGQFDPVSIRHLDGQDRGSSVTDRRGTVLRSVMVGHSGSISTIRDALEVFRSTSESEQIAAPQPADVEAPALKEISGAQNARRRRWNRAPEVDELAKPIDALLQKAPLMPTSTVEAVANTTASSSCQQRKRCQKGQTKLSPYIFDMETGDPDDVLTLLLLASHPSVELRAVTITPGSEEQVAMVRWLLQQLGLTDVRVGAQSWPSNAGKPINLSTVFYKSIWPESERKRKRSTGEQPECERADRVLFESCDESVTLVTGAALHNLGDALKIDGFSLGRWVAQGGFAGEGVVPLEKQMDKFKGKKTCSTFNFGGNIPAAQAALASSAIERKICVSKNVCHSVLYNAEFHEIMGEVLAAEVQERPRERRAIAFKMIYDAMDEYLRHKPGGKALHDPLALATAFDESVCELAEVELFCCKGQWGSRLRPGNNVWISISYDALKFQNALLR
mmetsp:Transcript_99779/g.172071  ORF Transcript_99779/g.172071 Transcript_99779/m.172071 type:complete len:719 (-) Transcript_99779:187-2343(-)